MMLRITGFPPLSSKSHAFKVRPNCPVIPTLLAFEIARCAINHGKMFPKLSETSFSGIVSLIGLSLSASCGGKRILVENINSISLLEIQNNNDIGRSGWLPELKTIIYL